MARLTQHGLVALSAQRVTRQPDGSCSTLFGTTEADGGRPGGAVPGIVKHLHLGALQPVGEI